MSVEYRADDETGEGEAVAHFLHQWSGGAERGGRDPLADEMIDHATDDLASTYVGIKGSWVHRSIDQMSSPAAPVGVRDTRHEAIKADSIVQKVPEFSRRTR